MRIQGRDIQLRPLVEADAERIIHYGNNRRIWLNLTDAYPFPYTEKGFLERIEKLKLKKDLISLGIIYKSELIGEVVASFREDVDQKKVFIAYWIGEEFWGKGLCTEAVGIFSKYLLENCPIKKIQARVFSWNIPSKKVLEKNGFRLEGTIREGIYKDGRYCDELIYGVLKEELNVN